MVIKDWLAAEKEVCRLLRAEHVGGPGQPDCRRGAAVVEVKHHNKRIGPDIIRRTMEKPLAQGVPLIVVSTSGFSARAVAFAQEHADVFLYEADLTGHVVRQIWPPEAEARRPEDPEAAPASKTAWWPLAAAGGLAVAGGVLLAVKHWAARRAA